MRACSESHNPAMLVTLLVYGYGMSIFSSRKLERSTYDSIAFRYIASNNHLDHDTIANFRKRFLKELSGLFVQILWIARQIGILKMGNVSRDGSKIKANAYKHKALSYEHACKLDTQLKNEVAELIKKAEAANRADLPDGLSIPEELKRRKGRLCAISNAKAEIERRIAERHTGEQAAYQKKMAERAQKEQEPPS